MNTKLEPFIGKPAGESALADLDTDLRAWALKQGSAEASYPVLMSTALLARAGYLDAFPHLLMTPAVLREPGQPISADNLEMTEWCLSPAVCYHTYARLEGRKLEHGMMITARGHCFRNEEAAEVSPGRRQIEFQMRELVLVGPETWIEEQVGLLQPGVEKLARACGLDGSWVVASDPFFLPRARGQAHMQRLRQTKLEWCLPGGLAVASINRHGTFFGERFHITSRDGSSVHSACIAFGLDRWASQAVVS